MVAVMTRVADLAGADLALWVARATKLDFVMRKEWPAIETEFDPETHCNEYSLKEWKCWLYFKPHEDWAQGGPLIPGGMVHHIALGDLHQFTFIDGAIKGFGEGPTMLIAAMRALVASKFGDQVDAIVAEA
jgi:hypothetical protein